ncbi:MAG: DUF2851 family protein, partial [Flavobacteriales bacterium]
MKEEFLQWVWMNKLLGRSDIMTTCGKSVQVLNPGTWNRYSGPDFLNAHLIINDVHWHGHVEIHIHSSDWLIHGHHEDAAYHNIILHAVFRDDVDIHLHQPKDLSVVQMEELIPIRLIHQYNTMTDSIQTIACSHQWQQVPAVCASNMMDQAATERMMRKCEKAERWLRESQGDWKTVLFRLILRSFGMRSNSDAMETLGERSSLLQILKWTDRPERVEAYLLGMAGLLSPYPEDHYQRALHNEFELVKGKARWPIMSGHEWRRGRVRPHNAPELRIAQCAHWVCQQSQIFYDAPSRMQINDWLRVTQVQVPDYWATHYAFNKTFASSAKQGQPDQLWRNVIINAIAPCFAAMGRVRDRPDCIAFAVECWHSQRAENNHMIESWKKLGVVPENAWESQGLIEQYEVYCS